MLKPHFPQDLPTSQIIVVHLSIKPHDLWECFPNPLYKRPNNLRCNPLTPKLPSYPDSKTCATSPDVLTCPEPDAADDYIVLGNCWDFIHSWIGYAWWTVHKVLNLWLIQPSSREKHNSHELNIGAIYVYLLAGDAKPNALLMPSDSSNPPTPTNLETDALVLSRLGSAEARIELLEERLGRYGNNGAPVAHNPLPPTSDSLRIPDLHTAAGHKILQYWPRLRVKLTIPGIEPFQFLKVADHGDLSLTNLVLEERQEFELAPIISSLEELYERFAEIPLFIVDLLRVSPYFSREHILEPLYQAQKVHHSVLNLRDCCIELLLMQTIAAAYAAADVGGSFPSSAVCLKLALDQLWKLYAQPDEYTIPLTLCFVQILLYFFARPFHVLGMLQALKPALSRFEQSRSREESHEFEKEVFNRLHYLLESDILTELDGVPSASSPQPLKLSAPDRSVVNSTHEYYFQSQMFLRYCLNRVLGSLYTANEAYITPQQAGPIISAISSNLETWFQSLPLDMQFSRNVSSFNLTPRLMPPRIKELALRYYACHFMLHRPVLYMVVYEDMEEVATPTGLHKDFEPWVLESCRSCTENAALIILSQYAQCKSPNSVPCHSWCELQLLVGSYAVLLQVQSVPGLAPMFRDLGEIDSLLDAAEVVLSSVPFNSLSTSRTLEVLTNVRHNMTLQTPQ
ncbi:hypothetical protein G7Y89_g8279 [Cudoniella acicularis]|uniref:Uncharacterized protein n=1 Tax=Cudoniella acicularis TaxID=354080 RepID=A0A8H4W3Q9_9HELO|nr:hypothetical protein G7Y89_g8279 [Cudoniella acicularis]